MMPRALLALLVVLTFIAPSRAAHAETPPIQATATFSAAEVTLGERLRLKVTVLHPSDVVVSVQPINRTPTLHVVEVLPAVDTPAGTNTATQAEYVLAAFSLGRIDMAPLRLAWLRADGESGEIEISPPPFTVRGTAAPGDTLYRPLKPTLGIAGGPPAWQDSAITGGAVVGGLLLLLGAAFVLRARWQRRAPMPLAMPPATIEEAACARLDAMAVAAPLADNDYDTYYGTISMVVRDYLQQRFAFGARALTTPELQRRMVNQGVERWQARLVAGLLDRCDGAVYAGRRPDLASADHDLTVAFEIIELSRPAGEPAPAEIAGVAP